MGTSCHIAYQCFDGSIRGCYVHYDGYPENMIPSIQAFLKERTTTCLMLHIKKAQATGGLRCFSWNGIDLDEARAARPPTARDLGHVSLFNIEVLRSGKPWEINDENFGKGTHHRYLFSMRTGKLSAESWSDKTGTWDSIEVDGVRSFRSPPVE